MARPRNCRRIYENHTDLFFKPRGIPICELEIETLKIDELEAMRLSYIEGFYQEEAAKIMGVSRTTFARILNSANKKVTSALLEKKAIKLDKTGNFEKKERKANEMKIAITTMGDDLNGEFSKHFGRCKSFVIYNIADDSFDMVDNHQNLDAAHGAGIQAAETVINSDVSAVISGDFGPKAFKVLKMNNIRTFKSSANTVKEAIDLFKQEKLEEIKEGY